MHFPLLPGWFSRKATVFTASAIIAALALFSSSANAESITVQDAWMRAVPPVSSNSAAYMILMNTSDKTDRLLGATSSVASVVELHKVVDQEGVMKMAPAGEVEIAAGAHLMLKPGGYHLMMLGLKRVPSEGEVVPMTLRFENAGELRIELSVKHSIEMPDHQQHGHMESQEHQHTHH